MAKYEFKKKAKTNVICKDFILYIAITVRRNIFVYREKGKKMHNQNHFSFCFCFNEFCDERQQLEIIR